MIPKNNIQNKTHAYTLRVDSEFQNMIDFLKKRTLLSKSSILRFAVAELYKKEYNKAIE